MAKKQKISKDVRWTLDGASIEAVIDELTQYLGKNATLNIDMVSQPYTNDETIEVTVDYEYGGA